jgi:solute carrier family 25 (mitochondrial S-adenosylmethionine transporter), member 26
VAAGAGALASTIVRVPTDTLRHRVQAYLHPNVFQAVPQLFRAKGLRGFFSGFVPTVLRDVPEIAIQFATYEALRATFQRRTDQKLTTWQHLLLGGTAGAIAAVFTMPLDVAKTQMQCGGAKMRELGLPRVMKSLCAEHGPQALFSGMVRAISTPA